MNLKKICVIHLNQIGDLIFSLPLLNALRTNFPSAAIHSVVKPYLKELLSCTDLVDDIIIRKKGLRDKFKLLKTMQANKYDLIICLSRSHECLFFTAFSLAGIKAGFAEFPWNMLFDIKENIEGHNSCFNNHKILDQLNIKILKDDYVGLINAGEKPDHIKLPDKFVIIAPCASIRRISKTWGQNQFSELIVLLKNKLGLNPVLVGAMENQEYNSSITRLTRQKDEGISIVDLSGKLDLKTLCSVIKQAGLFVGIDSGVMHLASCIDIPVVGLFGPTDPAYVGPHNHRSVVVREETMQCIPCYLKACKHHNCMKELGTEKVFNACKNLLNY